VTDKDDDLRQKQAEEEAARDRRWDARAERDIRDYYSREMDESNSRVALAILLLRSGESGPAVEAVMVSTMVGDPMMPVTQSVAETAAGIVDLARFRMGGGFPISEDDE